MTQSIIRKLVNTFLGPQKPKFSKRWGEDLILRVQGQQRGNGRNSTSDKMDLRILRTRCEFLHDQKLTELRKRCESFLKKYLLDHDLINSIVTDAYMKWRDTFKREKLNQLPNPEQYWLNFLAYLKVIDHFRRRHISLESLGAGDLDEEIDATAQNEPEDATALQPFEDIILGRKDYHLAEDHQTVTFKILSRAKTKASSTSQSKKVAYIASEEILRYYSLIRRVRHSQNTDELPSLIGNHNHNVNYFISYHQRLGLDLNTSLLDTNSVTGYMRFRHHVLCNADTRSRMEQALNLLRESADRKHRKLSGGRLGLQSRRHLEDSPVVAAVAVANDGRVYTSYTGELNESARGNRLVGSNWQKHCEESLIVDKVQEQLPFLKGGTLYVTLQPCGKTKVISEGPEIDIQIPSEVHCVEAGFANFYIGSLDLVRPDLGAGIRVLSTGVYEFKLQNGTHTCKASAALEKYFCDKGYRLIKETNESRQYKIGERANVFFFDADLMLEIYNLSRELRL